MENRKQDSEDRSIPISSQRRQRGQILELEWRNPPSVAARKGNRTMAVTARGSYITIEEANGDVRSAATTTTRDQ